MTEVGVDVPSAGKIGRGRGQAHANVRRFSGFAEVYEGARPAPPAALGGLLARYASADRPRVVDLGCGTGLSSRWAATWAGSVVGIEPNDDMRSMAESHPDPRVSFRKGEGAGTRLPGASADVVVAVQSFHWMEPAATLAEVARLLHPGGVFAAIDVDWPPVVGSPVAEEAWRTLYRRLTEAEERRCAASTGVHHEEPALGSDSIDRNVDADLRGNRSEPGGLRSWSKSEHLARLATSGRFRFTRELVMHDVIEGGVGRFVALMRSQSSYQRVTGSADDTVETWIDEFERAVNLGFAEAGAPSALMLCWRVRIGVVGDSSVPVPPVGTLPTV